MQRIDQSVAKRVVLKLYLASDHISPATGKTVAVVISKNGSTFQNPSAGITTATEIASGWYYVDLSTTDTGALGPLIVRGTESVSDPSEIAFSVEVAMTPSTITTQIFSNLVETGWTFADIMKLITATELGKCSGLPGAPAFRDINDTKTRVSGTTDSSGNRLTVSYDAS